MMKHALVHGWGAVEHKAQQWAAGATVEEVEIRVWIVRDSSGVIIGVIGKEPHTKESIQLRAESLSSGGER